MTCLLQAQLAALGRVVRRRRRVVGLTLAELAAASGVSESTLKGWEAGRRNPSVRGFFALASALGVRPGELLDERDG